MLEKYGALFTSATVHLSDAKILWMGLNSRAVIGDPGTHFVPLQRDGIEAATRVAIDLTRDACRRSKLDRLDPDLGRLEQLIWPPHVAPPPGGGTVATAITNFISRLQDELRAQYYFRLREQDVPLYGQESMFGDAVAKKFKGASADIQNAGNCLALGQGTACVFHLMRAMEVAVRKLGKQLNLTITPQTTWRQMTGQMDPKIKAMPHSTDGQKRKKDDWEAARANLHAVGSVWRNNTMHPASSYTPSQARDVLNAVRVFMTALAEL
jgi:hypothetical protein